MTAYTEHPGWARWLERVSLVSEHDSSSTRIAIQVALGIAAVGSTLAYLDGRLPQLLAWIMLAALGIRLAGEAVADRRVAGRWGPYGARIDLIDSPGQAIKMAQQMLRRAAAAKQESGDVHTARLWLTVAVCPFAALLYAASPVGTGKGRQWVHATARALADPNDTTAWQLAASAVGAVDAGMYEWIGRHAPWDRRLRASLGKAMLTALEIDPSARGSQR